MAELTPELKEKINYLIKYKHGGKEDSAAEDIQKLKQGERFEYVLGWTYFCGNKIDLSLRPFIPRRGSQPWVWRAVQEIKSQNAGSVQCLDPYAGSGCIGLAVLTQIPEACVDFVDIDQRALEQTKINLELHHIPRSRYSLIHANHMRDLPQNHYDYILANPPYIPYARREEVAPHVLTNEPHIAFFAGEDGLLCIRPLISEAAEILKPGGKIWIETGHWHGQSGLEQLFRKEAYRNIRWGNDGVHVAAERPNIPIFLWMWIRRIYKSMICFNN